MILIQKIARKELSISITEIKSRISDSLCPQLRQIVQVRQKYKKYTQLVALPDMYPVWDSWLVPEILYKKILRNWNL